MFLKKPLLKEPKLSEDMELNNYDLKSNSTPYISRSHQNVWSSKLQNKGGNTIYENNLECNSLLDDSKSYLYEKLLENGKIIFLSDSDNSFHQLYTDIFTSKIRHNKRKNCLQMKPEKSKFQENFGGFCYFISEDSESVELKVEPSRSSLSEVKEPQSSSEMTSEDYVTCGSTFPNTRKCTEENMKDILDGRNVLEKHLNISVSNTREWIQNHCTIEDSKEKSLKDISTTNRHSDDLVTVPNISVSNTNTKINVSSDSLLTLEGPQKFIFENSEELSEEILQAGTKNCFQNQYENHDLKVASEIVDISRGKPFLKFQNKRIIGVEKFETFKEIMEKLKKDISVIMNSDDLKDDIDSNTNILNKFNLLDNIVKQIYFIAKSLSSGGTYFIESLEVKRKEVSYLLKCLKEDVFQAYLKLQPDEKYFVARRGGPMGCIFTLFGVLERELRKAFGEISQMITRRQSTRRRGEQLFNKEELFCSAKSVPVLKLSFGQCDLPVVDNEEIIISSKDAATSVPKSFAVYPVALHDSLDNSTASKLLDLIKLLQKNRAHDNLNCNLQEVFDEQKCGQSDPVCLFEELRKYESEGFEIRFLHDCILLITPENMNLLIKNDDDPLKMSHFFNKTKNITKQEFPLSRANGFQVGSTCIPSRDSSSQETSTYYTSVSGDSKATPDIRSSSSGIESTDSLSSLGDENLSRYSTHYSSGVIDSDETSIRTEVKTPLNKTMEKTLLINEVKFSLNPNRKEQKIKFIGFTKTLNPPKRIFAPNKSLIEGNSLDNKLKTEKICKFRNNSKGIWTDSAKKLCANVELGLSNSEE